jgi:hypothetical protein
MEWLDTSSNNSKEKFIPFIFDMCEKCKLAKELLAAIEYMINGDNCLDYKLAMEHHKVITAIWFLLNGPDKFKDSIH